MKKFTVALFLSLSFISAFSQKFNYEYNGRRNPSIKKDNLKEVKYLDDISSELWRKMTLPYPERLELDRRKSMDYSSAYYLFPQENNYNKLVDYVAVEIAGISNGKTIISESPDNKLTMDQKNLLNSIDPGTDINIRVFFKYRSLVKNDTAANKVLIGHIPVTAIPAKEAEYEGGFKGLTEYLHQNIFALIGKNNRAKVQNAVVKFIISEQGVIGDVKLFRRSEDLKTDQIILDAIKKMPNWKPAQNSKGQKIKQEFSIPLGIEGGC
jgi:hypothetical protein